MKKLFFGAGIGLILAAGLFTAYLWLGVFNKSIKTNSEQTYFYLSSNANFDQLIDALDQQGIVPQNFWFTQLAELRHLPNNLYAGRYTIKNGTTWNELILQLRTGEIDEVEVTFNNVKTIEQLAEKVAEYIEPNKKELYNALNNPKTVKRLGFTEETYISLFLPNTYRFYWNATPEDFLNKMQNEYKKFWNEERKNKAKSLGLSQSEVTTLASIVQSEQSEVEEEWPTIAGLYINRIRKGMKLQSDPTVIFATGDFSIRRVLSKHLSFESPYNTYMNKGLPPGPIRITSTKAIDAVLNYEENNYLYMCAKPNSGSRHAFTNSYIEHLRNARIYQQSLNKKKIFE